MKNISLHAVGMDCPSCVTDIESAVKKLSGVEKIHVSVATNQIHISFDEKLATVDEIQKAIRNTGYTPTVPEHKMEHDMEDHSGHAMPESTKIVKEKFLKFLFGGVISVFLVTTDFFVDIPSEPMIGMILALLVLIFTSREFYVKGLPPFILRARPNMDTLVAIGISAAFLYSSYNVLFTDVHELYFMDVAVISTFIILGRYLEAKSKGKANEAVQKLLSLGAKVAHKKTNTGIEDIDVEKIKLDDLLVVKPGEKIPVDGAIIEGNAVIDESMVTGESIPVDKKPGSTVIGATLNSTTSFTMKAKKVGENTLLAQMIRLIEQAQMNKAPIQKLVDTVSKYFVWSVVFIAIVTFGAWLYLTGAPEQAIIVTVAVLIIACPCALGLATPISLVVGSGKGAEHGILIKDASALEKVQKINTICFDKTGTVTEGKPQVTEMLFYKVPKDVEQDFVVGGVLPSHSSEYENILLQYAASIEESSEHPLASAVVTYAKNKSIQLHSPSKVQSTTGGGIEGVIQKDSILVGSRSFMKRKKVMSCAELDKDVDKLMEQGKTVIYFAVNNKIRGIIAMQDIAKENVKEAIERLKKKGIHTIMMTGDNEKVGQAVGTSVGVDEIRSELHPEDKVSIIKELQKNCKFVAMVGDGINDAPALATADIGIAVGTGTDIAIESGDLVLVRGDIAKAVDAMELSQATMRNIKQNLFWAFLYNTVGIPVAVLGFLNPIFSAFAMALSSLSVVLNALRLKRMKLHS